MAYLINSARPTSLTIGSRDYVSNLVEMDASDSSAFRNGLITTTATITLGSLPGQPLVDYDRNDFRRGAKVTLDVTYPSGVTARHPRGELRVISAVYEPESESIVVEAGCDLVLTKLLDDEVTTQGLIQGYGELPLDPAQQTFENLGASLAASTKVVWSDSSGAIQKAPYFGADGFGTVEAGKFISVRGSTALAVEPLAAAEAIPDQIELSYSYPKGLIASDEQGRIDTTETESYYFLRYPAITYERQNVNDDLIGSLDLSLPPVTVPSIPIPASGCGNTPKPPQWTPSFTTGGGTVAGGLTISVPSSCSQNFQTVAVPIPMPPPLDAIEVWVVVFWMLVLSSW